ncbi:MAG: T9SS type A sorting domain-containing protein [Chitinophagaceae bacterium]|nr:T9SS type A sorting domain-containing protein [Chitinophagaceae bacterium]
MKCKLLLSTFIFLFSISSFAQDSDKTFAITGNGNGDFLWMNIRQIDLSTGSFTKNVFEKGATKFKMLDAATKNEVILTGSQNGKEFSSPEYPTATMVAAAAYDNKSKKLFFTPMSIAELRWVDLSSNSDVPEFYTLQSPLLAKINPQADATRFTRMTIGGDGNGYALTNDANHLIKFNTDKNITITDMGAIVDATKNNVLSIHDVCGSWGGDMVADALGNLYLFTGSKNVFKINLRNQVATHLGSISGLSGAYTLNGAAVYNDENVIISSANSFEGFFKVNMKDLAATKLTTSGQIFNASDLANGNLLFANDTKNKTGAALLINRKEVGGQLVSIFPNPVVSTQFNVTFNNKVTGEYQIVLTDIQGKYIISKKVFIKSADQVETIQMKTKPSNGMYLIKVVNANKKPVFSDKIVIE